MNIFKSEYFVMFSLIIIAGVFFSLPVFKYADEPEKDQARRNIPMDGIRGFLASFVAIFHSEYIINYIFNNEWKSDKQVFMYLSQFGVSIFFMITAYLFWGKVRKIEHVNWVKLYKDRVFRIAPATYVAALISIISILFFSNYPELNKLYLFNVIKWFDMGMLNNYQPINYYKDSWLFLGVFWTLQWEWGFYFCLPLLSIFKKHKLTFILSLMFLFVYLIPQLSIFSKTTIGICTLFTSGMLCMEIQDKINLKKSSLNIILCITIALIFSIKPESFTTTTLPLYITLFLCISKGADLFGLLTISGFVRLGNSSFSIYVLHCPIMYILYKVLHDYHLIDNSHSFGLLYLLLTYLFICLLSTVNFKFVEMTLIKIGRNIKL